MKPQHAPAVARRLVAVGDGERLLQQVDERLVEGQQLARLGAGGDLLLEAERDGLEVRNLREQR